MCGDSGINMTTKPVPICNLLSEQRSDSATPTPVTPMTLRTLADRESAERGQSPHSHHAVQDETNNNSQHS